jgi:competence protein ComEA
MLLLILNYSLSGSRKPAPLIRDIVEDNYDLKTEMLPAYQKMTLGIPLNLNSESIEGLTAIPGIGKSLANRIVNERIKRNGFKDINELRSIAGIGEKTFLKIAPHVTL